MSLEVEKSNELEYNEEINNWDELDIDSNLLRGIYSYGFEKPSPIQKKAIKPIIMGRDLMIQAQSGTGKTATFTIGALQRLNVNENSTQVLILSPTRELTSQTAKVCNSLGSILDGLRVQTLFGGSNIEEGRLFSNKDEPHIVCGCPGRVYDMLRRDRVSFRNIRLVILDEADQMLSAGFKEQVYNIFQYLSTQVQVVLVSATIPESLTGIIQKIMRNPLQISVKKEMLTLEGIRQFYIAVDDDRQKYATLKNIFSFLSVSQSIIYCNSVKRVMDLYDAMREDEFPVGCIHSNMDKSTRDKAFNDFTNGKTRVLISTNVTARGIDIQQVSIVINFDLPKCVHTYLHRIGRSGRWGRKGVGINLITRRDVSLMKQIEEHYSCQIDELPANFNNLMK